MFWNSYIKPGKGVSPRDPNTPRIKIFFELLYNKFWLLCKTNMFYLITSLPTFIITFLVMGIVSSQIVANTTTISAINSNEIIIVEFIVRFICSFWFLVFIGQGPTSAGYTHALRNYAREEHTWFLSDWWKQIKTNFKQAIIIFVIDLLAFFVFFTSIVFYINNGLPIISYLLGVVGVLYIQIHFYIYQLIITFENSTFGSLKNAVIFALEKEPRNILMLLIETLIHIGIPCISIVCGWNMSFWLIFILAELLVLPTLTRFMINFFIYPQLEKYIKTLK